MNGFESEMDEWMKKREELSHKADQLKVQRQDLLEATEVRGHLAGGDGSVFVCLLLSFSFRTWSSWLPLRKS